MTAFNPPLRLGLALLLAAAFDGLREAPPEGFLVGLLAPEPSTLPAGLLQIDSVDL